MTSISKAKTNPSTQHRLSGFDLERYQLAREGTLAIMSLNEAAAYLGDMSPKHLSNLANDRKVSFFRAGSRIFFKKADLDKDIMNLTLKAL